MESEMEPGIHEIGVTWGGSCHGAWGYCIAPMERNMENGMEGPRFLVEFWYRVPEIHLKMLLNASNYAGFHGTWYSEWLLQRRDVGDQISD